MSLYQLKSTNSSGALTLCQTLIEVQHPHWLLSPLSLGLIILLHSFSLTSCSCFKKERNEELFSLLSLNLIPWYLCTSPTLMFSSAGLSSCEFLFYTGTLCWSLCPLVASYLAQIIQICVGSGERVSCSSYSGLTSWFLHVFFDLHSVKILIFGTKFLVSNTEYPYSQI